MGKKAAVTKAVPTTPKSTIEIYFETYSKRVEVVSTSDGTLFHIENISYARGHQSTLKGKIEIIKK